ncbi:LLM class flavin-dependent oxidoreductase [Herbiconiux sp. CPCC 203407]|uniref:LLM class flavin-dependent oxidoreductase n=1 Tax=Herbiconiux oxytropis TaxID=2970915 RepID=A0AA41XA37_9MICO|nr:LLM class flavin-dependent oxidoreductase [Herbiconiux oxytropis]MCS5724449.1 LLM class flavin-dependent oxidoreductase [Herbiconiux oxytropis]
MTTPSRPVRIGVQIAPQHAEYRAIRDTLAALEDLGVDIAFNWDHFYPLSGEPDGLHFEGWTMLAAWAEQTSRIQFGPLVTCNSYRNPELLADMARTVDHISAKNPGDEGRLIFGIGSGWFERDYDEYGYEFGTAGQRLDALGGGGEKKTLRIVAEHADIWHSFSDVETLERKLVVLREWCDKVGRDPSEIEVSTGTISSQTSDRALLDRQLEAGVTLFTLGISGPDLDLSGAKELLAWRDSL